MWQRGVLRCEQERGQGADKVGTDGEWVCEREQQQQDTGRNSTVEVAANCYAVDDDTTGRALSRVLGTCGMARRPLASLAVMLAQVCDRCWPHHCADRAHKSRIEASPAAVANTRACTSTFAIARGRTRMRMATSPPSICRVRLHHSSYHTLVACKVLCSAFGRLVDCSGTQSTPALWRLEPQAQLIHRHNLRESEGKQIMIAIDKVAVAEAYMHN